MQCVVSSVPVSSDVNHLVGLESEWLSEIHALNYYIIIKWFSKFGIVDVEVRVKLYIVQSGLEGSCSDETVLLEHIVIVVGVIYPNPVVLAVAEEGTKFFFMYRRSWKHPAFNYKFDGIVYSVFTSLGFAAFENIIYVFNYGPAAILSRAVLSIPGHMNFAIVAGLFYGRAKVCERYGDMEKKKSNSCKITK